MAAGGERDIFSSGVTGGEVSTLLWVTCPYPPVRNHNENYQMMRKKKTKATKVERGDIWEV